MSEFVIQKAGLECPVCEYAGVKKGYRMHDRFFRTTDEGFLLHCCPSCGLLFLDEGLVKDQIPSFYPPGYWWSEEGACGKLERRYREWMVWQDQLRFVRQCLGGAQGLRLLDIGCGSGTFVKMSRHAGMDSYGLELSAEAVEIARQESGDAIIEGDEEDLFGRPELYDVVTMFHSLEHMTGPFRFLKRLQQVLRSEGSLFVQVPNVNSLQAKLFGSRWYGLDCPRHLYNYSLQALFYLLGRAGYRVRAIRHFSLRDNAAAIVSSLLPSLDPMSSRVRSQTAGEPRPQKFRALRDILYFSLYIMAQPVAVAEAALKRGGTITIWATGPKRP